MKMTFKRWFRFLRSFGFFLFQMRHKKCAKLCEVHRIYIGDESREVDMIFQLCIINQWNTMCEEGLCEINILISKTYSLLIQIKKKSSYDNPWRKKTVYHHLHPKIFITPIMIVPQSSLGIGSIIHRDKSTHKTYSHRAYQYGLCCMS